MSLELASYAEPQQHTNLGSNANGCERVNKRCFCAVPASAQTYGPPVFADRMELCTPGSAATKQGSPAAGYLTQWSPELKARF